MSAQVLIDGVAYEMPESYKLKELRIIERYTQGHSQGDTFEISKLCGAIHVAIARAKPEVPFEEIQAVIDEIEASQLEEIIKAAAGQSPPAESTSEKPDSSSDASGLSSDPDPENESQTSSGSPDLAGFTSFHSRSEN